MTNSNDTPHSSFVEVFGVALLFACLVAAAAWYFYSSGSLLYYGDAAAHLNISRSWIDARNTGYDQIGTVWLPVLHLICLPFVRHDGLWESGLAGTIPVAGCFVIACVSLYLCAKETFQNSTAAMSGLLCFALNPNILYLASITMSEMVFMAGLSFCLLCILWYRKTQHARWCYFAVVASWWMSLARYDGWFLIPFIAFLLAAVAQKQKLRTLIVTGLAASLAPIYWIAHNWWETGNALDFYNGPYSAAAIQGDHPYPGFHDWPQAIHYYWEAGRLCSGNVLLLVGILGLLVAIVKGRWLPVAFLSLTPVFYVWSIHSSKTPIHLPTLWPNSYYNTRYGLAVVMLLSFAVTALASALPKQFRAFALLLPLLTLLPWLLKPVPGNWICWTESQHNSDARRVWTTQAAAYLKTHYRTGQGILVEFGDMAAIFPQAGIPFKETLHEGSHEVWFANTMSNGVVHQMQWAVAQAGDKLAQRLANNGAYHTVQTIIVPGAPDLLIYERN